VRLQTLSNGDKDRALEWQVCNYKSSGDHVVVGLLTASVNELLSGKKVFDLKMGTQGKSEKVGEFRVVHCVEEKAATFLEYLRAGIQLNLHISVDFTMSNGNVSSPESLHYRGSPGSSYLNDYERAIIAIGKILLEYDSDQLVPLYGFGGKLPSGSVSHCWPLNGDEANPSCHGLKDLLSSYRLALDNVDLAAPTNFTPSINRLIGIALREQEAAFHNRKKAYHVLLMITDGVITDMDSTIRAIIRASKLPISIIIVGVGNADFANMNVLDGDGEALNADGEIAVRDVVQFVPMRQFMTHSGDPAEVGPRLAKEVLAELPQQLVDYYQTNNIQPQHL
jgi:hypothetical protein